MLEMETLSPLKELDPGASAEHREEWELFDNVDMPPGGEGEIEETLKAFLTK